MIYKPCYLYWSGKAWPFYVEACVESIIKIGKFANIVLCVGDETPESNGFERQKKRMHVEPVKNLLDAKTFEIYQTKFGNHPAPKSDFFRYNLLYQHGGYYLDTDVFAIQDFTTIYPVGGSFISGEMDGMVSIGVMYFDAGHRALGKAVDGAVEAFKGGRTDIGPLYLTKFMGDLHRLPTKTFYPYYSPQWEWMFKEDSASVDIAKLASAGTYCVHLWGDHFRRNNFYPDQRWVNTHPRCLFSKMVDLVATNLIKTLD